MGTPHSMMRGFFEMPEEPDLTGIDFVPGSARCFHCHRVILDDETASRCAFCRKLLHEGRCGIAHRGGGCPVRWN